MIWDFIKDVCRNLPCPFCAEHATMLLNKYKYYNKIKKKDDLKQFILEFHNIVNKKTKKPLQDKTILNKYKSININKLLQLWNYHFTLDIHDLHLFKKKNDILNIKRKITNEINNHKYLFND